MDKQANPVVLTPGEPAGIGPDITVMMAQHSFPFDVVAIADVGMLSERADMLGLPLRISEYRQETGPTPHQAGTLTVLDFPCARKPRCGQLDSRNVPYVLDAIRRATTGCLGGEFAALVTGPVHKGIINEAGINFTGHTEFLAELTQSRHAVMMLATTGLRVALVTTHMPLREVSDHITPELVENTLRVTRKGLQEFFAIDQPEIVVCGLNPHAGEGGHLGHEDEDIIVPVIMRLRAEGFNIHGPLPADTAFIPKYLDMADVFIAMYHDQGLPVLKHMGFGNAINITLGLPLIRTSVDHGTALELSGSGTADVASLVSAIKTADLMISNRLSFTHRQTALTAQI